MRNLNKYYSSIILLIIGVLIAKTQILFGDGCYGLPDAIQFIILFIIYILVLLAVLIISIFNYFKKKVSFNYSPVITTFIVGIIVFLAFNSSIFESSTLYYATTYKHNTLTLRNDNSFTLKLKELEWNCYYKGKYKLKNDTLFLLRSDIQNITNNLFTDKYLFDKSKKILFPIDNNKCSKDSTRCLFIRNED